MASLCIRPGNNLGYSTVILQTLRITWPIVRHRFSAHRLLHPAAIVTILTPHPRIIATVSTVVYHFQSTSIQSQLWYCLIGSIGCFYYGPLVISLLKSTQGGKQRKITVVPEPVSLSLYYCAKIFWLGIWAVRVRG